MHEPQWYSVNHAHTQSFQLRREQACFTSISCCLSDAIAWVWCTFHSWGDFCTPFRLYILTGNITTCYGCKERFVRAGPQYNLIVHEKTDHSSTQGQVLQCSSEAMLIIMLTCHALECVGHLLIHFRWLYWTSSNFRVATSSCSLTILA